MAKLNDIIDRIRKLQAKANDSATTEAEASLFAAKVAELLIQHSLDPSVLKDVTQEEIVVNSEIYDKAYVHPWRTNLANAVSRLYFCRLLIMTLEPTSKFQNAKKRMAFIGKPHNRAISISMFQHFEKTINRLARERYENRGDIAAFERGCGLRLVQRIDEYYVSLQKPTPKGDTSVPVLYKSEEKQVQDYLAKMQTRKIKQRYDLNSRAVQEGMRAAHTISLNTQVQTYNNDVKLLG